MTQSKTVLAPLLREDMEGEANPYNAKKEWHNVKETEVTDANTLFFEPKKGKTEPKEPEKSDTSEGEPSEKDTHDYKKRWVALKNHYDLKQTEWKEKLASLESGEQTSVPFSAPKTEAEVETFKQENPEFYAFMESIAHTRSQEESSVVRDQLSDLEKREQKLAMTQATKEIIDAHNDFNELKNSEDFHDWAKTQPKEIQGWIYTNPTDSSLAIRAIDLYKADIAKIEANVESTKRDQVEVEDAASLVSIKPTDAAATEGPKIWSEREIAKLTPDQYAKYEEEIDLAVFEGRVRSN